MQKTAFAPAWRRDALSLVFFLIFSGLPGRAVPIERLGSDAGVRRLRVAYTLAGGMVGPSVTLFLLVNL